MIIDKDLFGPRSIEEKEVFSLESLVFSVQVMIQRAMNKHGITNKALAEKTGMSPARISQIFSDHGPNLTLKTIAKIQTALGEDFEFMSKSDIKKAEKWKMKASSFPFIANTRNSPWQEVRVSNSNRPAQAAAA